MEKQRKKETVLKHTIGRMQTTGIKTRKNNNENNSLKKFYGWRNFFSSAVYIIFFVTGPSWDSNLQVVLIIWWSCNS
jgi:hypothetical protein